MDSQGVDNLSCYGYERHDISAETSPNIDKVAKDGVVFLNNFTPCVWTVPSHASLFTGRYLSGHQTLSPGLSNAILSEDIPTISEALNAIGYKTAAFIVNSYIASLLRHKDLRFVRQAMEKEKDTVKSLFEEIGEPEGRDKGSLYAVHLVKNWIDKNYDGKTPFYIFINCTEPHTHYWPGEPFRSRFLPPGVTEERAKKTPQMSGSLRWRKEYPWSAPLAGESYDPAHTMKGVEGEFGYPQNPEDWFIIKALLDGETAQIDHRIGILFDYLREKGIYDDTLIIITSDHHDVLWEQKGEILSNGHIIHTGHTDVYDPNIHIPLIVKGYPEHFPPGTHVKNMTDLTDIFPTLIEILGIEEEKVKKSVQGYSLLSALNKNPRRKFIMAEGWWPFTGFYYHTWFKAYRDLEYKYIWRAPDEKEELYNIVNDPYEQENIISKMPEKGKALKNELEKFLLSIEIPPIRLKRATLKHLIAWGQHREIIPTD